MLVAFVVLLHVIAYGWAYFYYGNLYRPLRWPYFWAALPSLAFGMRCRVWER